MHNKLTSLCHTIGSQVIISLHVCSSSPAIYYTCTYNINRENTTLTYNVTISLEVTSKPIGSSYEVINMKSFHVYPFISWLYITHSPPSPSPSHIYIYPNNEPLWLSQVSKFVYNPVSFVQINLTKTINHLNKKYYD